MGRTVTLYEPSPKQKLFLQDTHTYVAFGGARGGGKSYAVRFKAIILCLKYPGIRVMIVRKTYPELNENHIHPICEALHCYDSSRKDRVATYNDSKKVVTFENSSRIIFRYCDTEKDAERFQGTEVDALFVDEAGQQTEEVIKKLTACVRGVNQFPKRIYFTLNPGGVGHAWVKRLFIDRNYKDGENPEDYSFIQSLVTDNQALMVSDPNYITKLQALPDKLRRAWLYGDWDSFEGAFFEEFRDTPDPKKCEESGISQEEAMRQRRWTHVIEPFDIASGDRRNWPLYRSYDFGYARPFSCAWWTMDRDGVLYRVLELYGCTNTPNEGLKWTPEQQFREISKLENTHPWLAGRKIIGVADPAIWDASHGESIADTAAKYGVVFAPGDNERVSGWMQVHFRLQFSEDGYPNMYVFNNCKDFIRTIPLLMYSETKPEDLDTKQEDHIADETRYMCMSRPIAPADPEKPYRLMLDPLSEGKVLKKYYNTGDDKS